MIVEPARVEDEHQVRVGQHGVARVVLKVHANFPR